MPRAKNRIRRQVVGLQPEVQGCATPIRWWQEAVGAARAWSRNKSFAVGRYSWFLAAEAGWGAVGVSFRYVTY